jgi:hypothetical protein
MTTVSPPFQLCTAEQGKSRAGAVFLAMIDPNMGYIGDD